MYIHLYPTFFFSFGRETNSQVLFLSSISKSILLKLIDLQLDKTVALMPQAVTCHQQSRPCAPTLAHTQARVIHVPHCDCPFPAVIVVTSSVFPSEFIETTFNLWVSHLRCVSAGSLPQMYLFVVISLSTYNLSVVYSFCNPRLVYLVISYLC